VAKTIISSAGFLATASLSIFVESAFAKSDADNANKINNPLNLAASFDVQNYYTPSRFDTGAHANSLLLRPAVAIGPVGPVGVPQIFRTTVPVSTAPNPMGRYNTGLGDIKLFGLFLLSVRHLPGRGAGRRRAFADHADCNRPHPRFSAQAMNS
jgi:hypothetical protein